MSALLRVEHLTMRFGGLIAVNDLTFTASRGDITALIGPNGAGKTTVFNCITGFYKPSEGRIALAHGAPQMWDEFTALTRRDARRVTPPDGALFLLAPRPRCLGSPGHPPPSPRDPAGVASRQRRQFVPPPPRRTH